MNQLATYKAGGAPVSSPMERIISKIFMTYRKDLTNLALQERRLRNQRKADIAELHQLQKERLEKAAREAKKPAGGFDFSLLEFQIYHERNRAQYPVTQTDLDFQTFLAGLSRPVKRAPSRLKSPLTQRCARPCCTGRVPC